MRPWRQVVSAVAWVGALSGCAEGTIPLPETEENEADADAGAAEASEEPKRSLEELNVPRTVALDIDDDGRLDGATAIGAEGKWDSANGEGSNISLTFEGGKVCLRGSTAAVVDSDWTTYWGVEAVLPLCQPDGETASTISDCPSADELAALVGVRFTLEADAMPWRLNVGFEEKGREDVPAVPVTTPGDVIALMSKATVPFQTDASPPNPEDVVALRLHILGLPDGEHDFDLCLSDLTALTGDGWEEELIPKWLTEPGPGMSVELAGVNLVGAEFGESNIPGTYGSDYIYPSQSDIDYYAESGMNVARLPFLWERLQPDLGGALEDSELELLRNTTEAAIDAGLSVILDPHNFARFRDPETGESLIVGEDFDVDEFANFWQRVATEFKDEPKVIFGLMNEPHDMETETWLEAANAAIAAIRETGAKHLILVPGNAWTGAHNWSASYYGTPNAEVMVNVVDPEDNFAFELHQYLDADSSGTNEQCVSEDIGVERVSGVTAWLEDNGYRAFLGEFGGSTDPICLTATDNLLQHLGDHSEAWMGWAVWASTGWFIQHNIRPASDGSDSLQMLVLKRHLNKP